MSKSPRGRLKIFMSYAPGVGKTCQMLEEARQIQEKNAEVVVGYLESHGRDDSAGKAGGLEVLPRSRSGQLDTEGILARHPQLCVIDELAHNNPRGSDRATRWEDVQVLLDAGVSVYTTIDVYHLESLNDQVFRMSGIRVNETVPDWVVDEADEVVFVDLTPRALRNRVERGVVHPPEQVRGQMEKFFSEANLNALREMALRIAAHEIEGKMGHGAPEELSAPARAMQAARPERILICLTGSPSSAILLRRGKRVADYLQADCLALHVLPRSVSATALAKRQDDIEQHLGFARNLRIQTFIIESDNVAAAIADFARAQRVTQIFVGRPARQSVWRRVSENTVQQVVRLASDKQITIVARRK